MKYYGVEIKRGNIFSVKNGSGGHAFTYEQYKQLQQLYERNGPRFSNEQYRKIQEIMTGKKDQLPD